MLTKSESFKQNARLVVTNSITLQDEITDEKLGKGRKFISRFIEPGMVHYKEFGDVLITKETLDKFIDTMVGCPVIINHKDITDKNVEDERVGVVSRVWYNPDDNFFYCEGIIWDKDAISLVKNHNWNVSCSYDFKSDFESKTHNGKKISCEFTDGNFLHLALVEVPRYERANIVVNNADIEDVEEIKENRKENVIMTALNELENFVRNIVENACKKEEVKNEKVDKRDIIRQIMAIAGKHEDNEDVRTIAKLAEKLAYEKSEDGTADNECKVENEDKRKLIDEIGGILKGKVDDEIIRTIMKKAEELAYEKSEAGTADNKCKNADEEEKEEKFEEEKEIADNTDVEVEEEEIDEEELAENECKKDKKVENSMEEQEEISSIDKAREIVYNGNNNVKSTYITKAERLELGNNY